MNVPIAAQVESVRREIAMRRRVYPRWVQQERMTQKKADDELAAMEAVLAVRRGMMPCRAPTSSDSRSTPQASACALSRNVADSVGNPFRRTSTRHMRPRFSTDAILVHSWCSAVWDYAAKSGK